MIRKPFRLTSAALLLTAALGVTAQTQSEPVTLYGLKTYCESGCVNGIYSLPAQEDAQPEIYWPNGDMFGTGGAVYAEGKFYVLTYIDFFGTQMWYYQIADVESKTDQFIMDQYEYGFKDAGSAMTYDHTTGNAYSVCLDADDTSKFTLSIMDLATGLKTPVANMEMQMCAMSVTSDGTLYGIGMDGNLYTINKFTAEYTLVGPTGVSPQSNQSAVIDFKTDIMYWSAYTENGGALYTVDIKTGAATLLSEYEDKYQLVGLFIKQTANQEGAPGSVEDVALQFDKATTNATISFKAPALDVNGEELKESLTYRVQLDDEILASGNAEPGSEVKTDIKSPREGNCHFTVYIANSAGEGRPVSVDVFVGMDTPAKVENLLLTNNAGELTLTWNLPEKGINGGYVDPETTRYQIVRGPYEDLTIEAFEGTEYHETFTGEGVNPHMYLVTPFIDDKIGETALSNTVLTGEYQIPPFTEDLTDQFRSLVFTIIDGNEDNYSWNYDWDEKAMRCDWPMEPTSNEWFVSPPMLLEPGKEYSATISVRSEGIWNHDTETYDNKYAGRLSMYLSNEYHTDESAELVMDTFDVEEVEWTNHTSKNFTVTEKGIYYLGIHHSGERSIYYTYLRSLEVTAQKTSGITLTDTDGSLRVTTTQGMMHIENPDHQTYTILTIDGRLLHKSTSENASYSLNPGIYIVSAPGHAQKVLIGK